MAQKCLFFYIILTGGAGTEDVIPDILDKMGFISLDAIVAAIFAAIKSGAVWILWAILKSIWASFGKLNIVFLYL